MTNYSPTYESLRDLLLHFGSPKEENEPAYDLHEEDVSRLKAIGMICRQPDNQWGMSDRGETVHGMLKKGVDCRENLTTKDWMAPG